MKQLYSVGPLTGSTLPTQSAALGQVNHKLPSFKAATRGLREEDVQAGLKNSGYAPPPAWNSEGSSPLPVRLALLQTPSSGRILAHVSPNGGTYFAHALLNVPTTADAQLAIKTWGSPRWQRHETEGGGDLPELPYLPVADLLDDEALRIWLTESAQQMVGFVLSALLTTTSDTRIVVAASAEDVARIVYAVTRALPHNLLDNFTFSTYESDPSNSDIRLIGHDNGQPDCELPNACYEKGSVAFNLFTGRKSELPASVPFAAFAVKALASGETALLDELQTTWQLLGLTETKQFDLVYRLSNGSLALTKEEAVAAASQPTLAAWIAARPEIVSNFVSWALDDGDFGHHTLGRLIAPLRKKTDAIPRVVSEVEKAGLAAIISGEQGRVSNAFEVILPMAAPARANAVWGDILSKVTDPSVLAWDMRRYLLPRLVRFKHQNTQVTEVEPALAKWLDVQAEQLQDLLSLDLPKAYHLAASQACLSRDGEPSPVFARAVAAKPEVVLSLLRAEKNALGDRGAALFGILLSEVPDHHWFDDVLSQAETFSTKARNRLFEVALSAGKIDPDHVIRTQGSTLLKLFSGETGLDQLGRLFLNNPPSDIFTDRTVLEFLGKLKDEQQVGDDVKARISAVQVIRQFLDKPDFSTETFSSIATALKTQPPLLPTSAGLQVLEGVTDELSRRSHLAEFQRDLELVLLHFGTVLAENTLGLYRELLRRMRARRDFGGSRRTIHAFLAVALGASQNEDVAKATEGLEAEAFAIATDAARHGGRRALAEIDSHSKSWPKSARTQWGFLVEAVRPKEIGRSLRELCLFAAGAGAATVVWLIVAYFTR
jgi:hypothetical protein